MGQRLEQKLSVAEVFDHVERKFVTADKQTINSKGEGDTNEMNEK